MEKFFDNKIKCNRIDLSQNEKRGYILYSNIKIDQVLNIYKKSEKAAFEADESKKTSKSKNITYKNLKDSGEDFIHRFYYYQEIVENNKPEDKYHATIIMMNPAFAYSKQQDSTIDNIYNYLKSNNFKSFGIVNLSSIRTPSPKTLSKLVKQKSCNQYDKINREFIEYVLDNTQKNEHSVIIAAWGSDAKDNKTAKKFFENKSYKLYCFGMTAEKFPKHFSPLSFNNVNKYSHPIPYLVINNWLRKENIKAFDSARIKEIKNFIDWLYSGPKINHAFIEHHKNLLQEIKDSIEALNLA